MTLPLTVAELVVDVAGEPVDVAASWENRDETGQRVNADRPLTHSLDSTEEGLAMQATSDDIFGPPESWQPAMGPPPEPASDFERMAQLSEALGIGAYSDVMHMMTMPGAPWSKARPRFARSGHTYVPADDRDAQERTAAFLRSRMREPFTGNVALGCVFFRPNRQRIDTDNLIKHVCDAATGVVWADDSQCTAVMGVLEIDRENPRTLIVIGKHYSTLTRGSDATYPCAVCGKPINIHGQAHARDPKKTCSKKCGQEYRGFVSLERRVPCPACGTPFRRASSYSKYCSRECAVATLRNRRRAAASPMSECSTCGKTLDHKRGGRCRACWCADPSGRQTAQAEGRLW